MPLTVASFPSLDQLAGNPYWSILHRTLGDAGARFVTDVPQFGRRWLWANRKVVGVLHFHYVQQSYSYDGTRARLRWVLRFGRNLLLARAWGYHTVFTLHNLVPTYPLYPGWLDYLGHWMAANLTDSVIVHCRYARSALAARFGRKRGVHIVSHPHYVGIYPNDISPGEARSQLGLSVGLRVFLFLGGIRPNKGLEALCTAFASLPDRDARLIIAGNPWPPPEYVEELEELAADDARIQLVPRFIPDKNIQVYLNAADVVVLPFASVLTSGSAMLAMSFGRPLVVPAMGCLPELVSPDAGILYNASEPGSLLGALETSDGLDLDSMGRNALAKVSEFSWASFARGTLAVYQRKG